ncbi:MAG: hypothetical protein WC748_08110 [Legionellales bacterium]
MLALMFAMIAALFMKVIAVPLASALIVFSAVAAVISALGMLGDWLYERRYYSRVIAPKQLSIEVNQENQASAGIKLQTTHNNKYTYEFASQSFLSALDQRNGRAQARLSLSSPKLLVASNYIPHFKIIIQHTESPPQLTKYIKGVRTLLAELLARNILEKIEYEVQDMNGARIFGLEFIKHPHYTAYDVQILSSEFVAPGVAQAVDRLFNKSILLNYLQSVSGLPKNERDINNIDDKVAYKNIQNYFVHQELHQDQLRIYTQKFEQEDLNKKTPNMWQAFLSLLSESFFVFHKKRQPEVPQEEKRLYKILTAGTPNLEAELSRVLLGYTQTIQHAATHSEEGLDGIYAVLESVESIKKKYLQHLRNTDPALTQTIGFDGHKFLLAFDGLYQAIWSRGLYGQSLLTLKLDEINVVTDGISSIPAEYEWALQVREIEQKLINRLQTLKDKHQQEIDEVNSSSTGVLLTTVAPIAKVTLSNQQHTTNNQNSIRSEASVCSL